MSWLDAFIWWMYRTIANVMEYSGFFGLVAFALIGLLNWCDWLLESEVTEVGEGSGD